MIEDDGIRVRRATRDDLPFLLEVMTDDDVQPFLAGGAAFDAASVEAELERVVRLLAGALVRVRGEPVVVLAGVPEAAVGKVVLRALTRVAWNT